MREFIAHFDCVTCICLIERLNIIISGGEDGSIYIRNLYDLKLITYIKPEQERFFRTECKILDIKISNYDLLYIQIFSHDEIYLIGYNLNGLNFGILKRPVNCYEFTPAGNLIISEYFSEDLFLYHPITFKMVILIKNVFL